MEDSRVPTAHLTTPSTFPFQLISHSFLAAPQSQTTSSCKTLQRTFPPPGIPLAPASPREWQPLSTPPVPLSPTSTPSHHSVHCHLKPPLSHGYPSVPLGTAPQVKGGACPAAGTLGSQSSDQPPANAQLTSPKGGQTDCAQCHPAFLCPPLCLLSTCHTFTKTKLKHSALKISKT